MLGYFKTFWVRQ